MLVTHSNCTLKGNKNIMVSALVDSTGQALPKRVRVIHLVLDENSLRDRMDKVRGFCSLNQMERLFLVCRDVLDLNEHDRLHWSGCTNRGNNVGPIAVAAAESDETWRMPVKAKKDIIGKNAKILVGGPADDDGGEADTGSKPLRKAARSGLEPVFFHSLPISTDEEWHHSYDLSAVISLTVGPGNDALTCVRNRKAFFGVTLTAEHSATLTKWLEAQVPSHSYIYNHTCTSQHVTHNNNSHGCPQRARV